MKKFFQNRTAIIAICVISISISLALIVPKTYAYYKYNIMNNGNKITSASIDFDVFYQDNNNNYVLIEEDNKTPVLITSNTIDLQIENKGTASPVLKLTLVKNKKETPISATISEGIYTIDIPASIDGNFKLKVEYKFENASETEGYKGDIKYYNFNYTPQVIKNTLDFNNSINSNENINNSSLTATPTVSLTPSPAPSAEPSASTEPTPSPIPSEEPSASAEPTPSPAPSAEPSTSAEPTPKPAPSSEPTQVPTTTEEPTQGIEPCTSDVE